ncbi:MAG: GerMN domain-containing protein [Treponema sp.]|nr:GerMN domain-containing protein [Treponema sp.]
MANKKEKKRSSSKRKSTGLALGVFILGIIVIFILFLIKKDDMLTNLKETNFFDRVFGSTPEFVQNHEVEKPAENEDVLIGTTDSELIIQIESDTPSLPKKNEVKVEPVIPVEDEPKTEDKKTVEPVETKTEPKVEEKTTTPKVEETLEKTTVVSTVKYTDLTVCFIQVDADGSILRKMIKRSVPKNDSPLTTAINLLLEGPDTTKNQERDLLTLIPAGTKLLSARVQDGVAYLNFNDSFMRNTEGVEGYIYSLQQIVYTATSFSTVKSVQFMIDGQKKDYLGDGQWIGSPLSRSSF